MAKEKHHWLTCIKQIAYATAAGLGVYMASVYILAALFEKSRTLRDIAAYVFLMAAYILFFYRFHAHDRLDTYAQHTDKFDMRKELLAYIRSEDRVLFLIYAICAVATDLSGVITQYAPANMIALVTMPAQGPWILFEKPILCTVLSIGYSFTVACVIALVRSRKIYVEKQILKHKKKNQS